MKHAIARQMFRSVEDQVVATVEPILREKTLEQARRWDVRFWVLLCCALGQRRAREAVSNSTGVAAKQVGPIIRSNLPRGEDALVGDLAKSLADFPQEVVNEELARRVYASIVTKLEGIADDTLRQEFFRLLYWGFVVLFLVTHAIHWMAF